jgi:hypothetical protein
MKNYYLMALGALLLGYRPALAQQERVGINTTSPTQALDVNGRLRVRSLPAPGTGQLLIAQPDGTLGLSQPLSATAGLGLSAQVAGTTPVTVGPAGGTAYSQVAAAGRYAFVAGGTQVRAYDLQPAPTVPAYTGTTATLGSAVQALAASATTLYAITSATLETYSLAGSAPLTLTRQAPVVLAPSGTTSTTVFDAVLAGRYLYVAARFAGSGYGAFAVVRVYDLVAPAAPALVATLPLGVPGRVQLAADASRGRLLVAPDGAAYQAYALATPTAPTPTLLATAPATAAPMPAFGGGLAVVGGILYGADNANTPPTLDIYDASSPADPSQPVNIGAVALPKPVQSLAVAGNYAYLLTADAAGYQLVAVLVAAPALVGLDAAGNVASVAPVLPPGDNLGNHAATQNLSLGAYQLVGNGGSQGLSIGSGGQVGIGTTAPTAALDVNGTVRATSLATSTVVAGTSLSTPTFTAAATGTHSPVAAATGRVTSTGANPAGSSNYNVARQSTGQYRVTFTDGPLATANLQAAVFVATLADGIGFVTYTSSSSTNYLDVYTSAANGARNDREFTFSVFLP